MPCQSGALFTCTNAPEAIICISLVPIASLPRAFSFNPRLSWHRIPERFISHAENALFTCTNAHEEFISSSGTAFLLSQLHLFRVCSLWNPYPHGMDYSGDLCHVRPPKDTLLYLHQCPWRDHLFQWGCISLVPIVRSLLIPDPCGWFTSAIHSLSKWCSLYL